MRDAFIETLLPLAKADRRILFLTGDLGFGVLNDFRRECSEQFYNVGVAEQNLAGVAAGLALSGHVVFTYSIANFPTLRCLEQVRNDICYHQLNVNIVSVGGGMAYGALGPSHFATEDLAILRALPGMTVVAPGDPVEVRQLLPQIVNHPGPVYLRLGRAGEQDVVPSHARVTLGEPTVVREGSGVLLLTTGGMLPVGLEAAELLVGDGIEAEVVSVHTLAPLRAEAILERAAGFDVVVTCEEHTVIGGLGGAVAEVLCEAGVSATFRRFGLKPTFPTGIGSQQHLRSVNHIDARELRSLVRALQSASSHAG